MFWDEAEARCNPGPVNPRFMLDLQKLVKFPVYGIILNLIPWTYPVIVGFLVFLVLAKNFYKSCNSRLFGFPSFGQEFLQTKKITK
jgi:hypothetical protein